MVIGYGQDVNYGFITTTRSYIMIGFVYALYLVEFIP